MKLSKNIIFLLARILFIFILSGCTPEQKIDIPLPEHPRPDFTRNAWLNLNGQWDFAFDSLEVGETDKCHVAWYSRQFEIPDNKMWDNKEIFIVIGACDFGTKLWLNEKFVGEHEGGYTPFQFDLTDFLSESGENCLVISRISPKTADKPANRDMVRQKAYGRRFISKQDPQAISPWLISHLILIIVLLS